MVTIEAWCARRPVVACNIPAVRSLINSGFDGDLVDVGDDAALAECLVQLLCDPDRTAKYVAAGRDRVEREFDWDLVVEGWERLLISTAASRK